MKSYWVEVKTMLYDTHLLFVSRKSFNSGVVNEFYEFWRTAGYECAYGDIIEISMDIINESKIVHLQLR